MFNIGFHGVHHAYSSMPAHSLPQFTGVLANEHGETESVYPNYRRAFFNMLPSLSNPRIGAQWLAADSTTPTSDVARELRVDTSEPLAGTAATAAAARAAGERDATTVTIG
jgi:hypothetical protein